MLQAIELTKVYRDHPALDRLNLHIEEGEIFCLLGANGAGKTTTINLFLNFIQPSSGQALVDGIDVTTDPAKARARLAYIPERVNLYPRLTGLENLAYFHEIGGGKVLSKAGYLDILVRAGLPAAAADRHLSTYSKGMRQKVGIAIALVKQAKALLLDEPTSGLDPAASNEFAATLRQISDAGTTVFMATHDLFRAKETSHRIGIMKQGVMVDLLTPSEITATDLEHLYLEHMRA